VNLGALRTERAGDLQLADGCGQVAQLQGGAPQQVMGADRVMIQVERALRPLDRGRRVALTERDGCEADARCV